jgi:hypothetical protein
MARFAIQSTNSRNAFYSPYFSAYVFLRPHSPKDQGQRLQWRTATLPSPPLQPRGMIIFTY